MLLGMEPKSVLLDRSMYWRLERSPMLLGKGPVNSLLVRMKNFSFFRVPKTSGMLPLSLLFERPIFTKLSIVILRGSSLGSPLSYRYNISSFWCCQIHKGIEPVKLFPHMCSVRSSFRFENESRISPMKPLLSRSNSWSAKA